MTGVSALKNAGPTVEMSMVLQAPGMKVLLYCEVQMPSYTEGAECKHEEACAPVLLPVDLVQVEHQLPLLPIIQEILLRAGKKTGCKATSMLQPD